MMDERVYQIGGMETDKENRSSTESCPNGTASTSHLTSTPVSEAWD